MNVFFCPAPRQDAKSTIDFLLVVYVLKRLFRKQTTARAPSRHKIYHRLLAFCTYGLQRLFRKQVMVAAVVVTSDNPEVKKSGQVLHRLRHAEVHQRGHLLARVSTN